MLTTQLREAWITVTPDGGLTNVSTTELAAQQWCRPEDAVVRLSDPAVIEVTQRERDVLRFMVATHEKGWRTDVVEALIARMVVPTALHVVAR